MTRLELLLSSHHLSVAYEAAGRLKADQQAARHAAIAADERLIYRCPGCGGWTVDRCRVRFCQTPR